MKRILDRDAADFCPDALSVRNAVLPWWARFTVLWMAVFFLLALVWAYLAKVEVIVPAPGRIVSTPPAIVMKPLERTVIREICVRPGDRVEAGQVLVVFDPVFSTADRERLAAEMESCEARFRRLAAEISGTEYVISDRPSEAEVLQLSIFRQRRSLYQEKMNYFSRELERLEKTRAARGENLDMQRERLATYKKIEKMHKEGVTAQVVSLLNLHQVELSRMELEAEIRDKENDILVLGSELQSREAERDAFRKDWELSTSEEMVKTQDLLIQTRKEYDKAMQRTTYVELRAPEHAVVHEVAPLAPGSAVREAESLVTLIPLGVTLEVEAEIRAEDIGKVHKGDGVRIKVSAFPFQRYGTWQGTVRVLSEDTFQKEGSGGGAFYRAHITLVEEEKAGDKQAGRLVPGMETLNEIRVGERRILEYLTDPIIKSLDESVREP